MPRAPPAGARSSASRSFFFTSGTRALLARRRFVEEAAGQGVELRGQTQEREAGLLCPRPEPERARLPALDPQRRGLFRRVPPRAREPCLRRRELRLLAGEDQLREVPAQRQGPVAPGAHVLLPDGRGPVLARAQPVVFALPSLRANLWRPMCAARARE